MIGGSIGILYEATPDPNILSATLDFSQGTMGPVVMNGKVVSIVANQILSQDITLDLTKSLNNVSGIIEVEYDVLIDGTVQTTVLNRSTIVATYDVSTGVWPGIFAYGVFVFMIPVPTLSAWGMAILAVMLLGAAALIMRRRWGNTQISSPETE